MPLTLKLSQQFYDRLGNEVANELVDALNTADEAYRADLYRVNEVNFLRFDARLEQRLAEFRAEVVQRIAAFESSIERRMADFEVKIEARLGRMESRMLRWMFTFWTGQLLALAGLLFLILRR